MKRKSILTAILFFVVGAIVYSSASFVVTKTMSLKRPKISTVVAPGYDSASVADLYEMGFKSSLNVQEYQLASVRNMYMEKYGLLYMTKAEVAELLAANNFIMGKADRYIGAIPKFAIDSIKSKMLQLNDNRRKYRLTLTHDNISFDLYSDDLKNAPATGVSPDWLEYSRRGGFSYFVKQSSIQKYSIPESPFFTLVETETVNDRLMIIAGAKDFNISGMQVIEGILSLPVPKDPIALLQVPGGYVELVNWQ